MCPCKVMVLCEVFWHSSSGYAVRWLETNLETNQRTRLTPPPSGKTNL